MHFLRHRFLSPGGTVFPGSAQVTVCGVSDPALRESRCGAWLGSCWEGDLSAAGDLVRSAAVVEDVRPEDVVTDCAAAAIFDLVGGGGAEFHRAVVPFCGLFSL